MNNSGEKKLLKIGFVKSPHGIEGKLYVHFYKKFLPKCKDKIFLEKEKNLKGPFELDSITPYKGEFLIKLKNINTREDSERLRGYSIGIEVKELPKDTFFVEDIIGCKVFSKDNELIGKITDVYKLPQGDVYCIEGREEILIPSSKTFIKEINVESKEIKLSKTKKELEYEN